MSPEATLEDCLLPVRALRVSVMGLVPGSQTKYSDKYPVCVESLRSL